MHGGSQLSGAVVVPAFGRAVRMGSDKLWLEVAGRPLVAWTLDAVGAAGIAPVTVVVAPKDGWSRIQQLGRGDAELVLIEGGARRQDSVRAAVELCAERGWDPICIHDAARPLCPPRLFHAVLVAASETGAATAAIPVVDSIKRIDDHGLVKATLDRSRLVAVQTPQAFRTELLRDAHRRALAEGLVADDDCALVEAAGHPVRVVEGDPANLKVTTPHDVALIGALLAARG